MCGKIKIALHIEKLSETNKQTGYATRNISNKNINNLDVMRNTNRYSHIVVSYSSSAGLCSAVLSFGANRHYVYRASGSGSAM